MSPRWRSRPIRGRVEYHQFENEFKTSRKLAAFYLDAEKVTKWIDELGRPFLEKSTSVGRSIDRSNKLLEELGSTVLF